MECNYRHRLVRKAADRLKMGRSSDWLMGAEGIGDRWPQVAEISRLSGLQEQAIMRTAHYETVLHRGRNKSMKTLQQHPHWSFSNWVF